jgi:hypothetical protein
MLLTIAKHLNYWMALLYIVLVTFSFGTPEEFKCMARVGYCGILYFMLKEFEEKQCGTAEKQGGQPKSGSNE